MPILFYIRSIQSNFYYSAVAFLCIQILARLSGGLIAYIGYLYLIIYASKGPQQVLQVLALIWFFSLVNPGLFPELNHVNLLRYVIIFSVFILTIKNYNYKNKSLNRNIFVASTLFLTIFFILHGFIFSQIPLISTLKSLVWGVVSYTILASWAMCTKNQLEQNYEWFFGFFASISVLSALLVFSPDIAFHNNGSGYQGFLNQPQAFGLTMAIFIAFALDGFSRGKFNSLPFFGIILCSTFLLFASKSRTSYLSCFIIISMYFSHQFFCAMKRYKFKFVNFPVRIFIPIIFIVTVVFVNLNTQLLHDFISKESNDVTGSIFFGYSSSRDLIIDLMLRNIQNDPLFGIGFGVSSNLSDAIIFEDEFFGLPIGAPVEKSFALVALLEEVGIFGFLIFIAWSWVAMQKTLALGITFFAMFTLLALVNLTESLIFSMGGMGMLVWLMLGWATFGNKHT